MLTMVTVTSARCWIEGAAYAVAVGILGIWTEPQQLFVAAVTVSGRLAAGRPPIMWPDQFPSKKEAVTAHG